MSCGIFPATVTYTQNASTHPIPTPLFSSTALFLPHTIKFSRYWINATMNIFPVKAKTFENKVITTLTCYYTYNTVPYNNPIIYASGHYASLFNNILLFQKTLISTPAAKNPVVHFRNSMKFSPNETQLIAYSKKIPQEFSPGGIYQSETMTSSISSHPYQPSASKSSEILSRQQFPTPCEAICLSGFTGNYSVGILRNRAFIIFSGCSFLTLCLNTCN